MPVNRAVLVERVGDAEADSLTLLQSNQRSRHRPVDTYSAADFAIDPDRDPADAKRDIGPANGRQRTNKSGRQRLSPSRKSSNEACGSATERGGAQKVPPLNCELIEHEFSL